MLATLTNFNKIILVSGVQWAHSQRMKISSALRQLGATTKLGDLCDRILARAADVALLVDKDGRVAECFAGQDLLAETAVRDLPGQCLTALVASAPETDLQAWLTRVRAGGEPASIRLTLAAVPGGAHPPGPSLSWSGVPLGSDGAVLLLGQRDDAVPGLRQRAKDAIAAAGERDGLRRAMVERYRATFAAAPQAVLFLDVRDGRIEELNPRAAKLLGGTMEELVGEGPGAWMTPGSARSFAGLTAKAMASDQPVRGSLRVRSRMGLVAVSLRAIRGIGRPKLMLLLEEAVPVPRPGRLFHRFATTLDASATGIAVTDADAAVIWANRSFLRITGEATRADAIGRPLSAWLAEWRGGIGFLLDAARETGRITDFPAPLSPADGRPLAATLSLQAISGKDWDGFGVFLRPEPGETDAGQATTSTVAPAALAEAVGQVALSDLVGAAVSEIERTCIAAALGLSSGNRARAAAILGLSRQALYTKLRRHALD